MEQLPVCVIVLTLNEESNIADCLESVSWARQVFVVDSGSTDRTIEIARQFTSNIVEHPFENYSKQRNWAIANLDVSEDWMFQIDADERVSPQLEKKLRAFFAGDEYTEVQGVLVRRRVEFLGRPIVHGGIYPTYHCRLFRKGVGYCEDRDYDQHFKVDGKTVQDAADLVEITASSLSEWTARHNRWARMEAQHLAIDNQTHRANSRQVQPSRWANSIERRRWLRASLYERSPIVLRAFLYFFVRYFLRLGFLDGVPGLIYHVLHGFWFRFDTDSLLYESRLAPEQSSDER